MFGSCFDERRLIIRSYMLSTGVTSRKTRGSSFSDLIKQLLQVKRGIQVAIKDQTTMLTLVGAFVQIHRFNCSTLRTAFGGRKEAVCQQILRNRTTHPCRPSVAGIRTSQHLQLPAPDDGFSAFRSHSGFPA